jgi:uncharacterized protein (DUF302 family)
MKNKLYYFSTILDCDFEEADRRARASLEKEGFGILTEIDFHEKIKEKLGMDFRKYRILGACNPGLAYRSIQKEDKIGIFMPCNVIVQETEDGKTEVAAMNPAVAMSVVENKDLQCVAEEVSLKLKKVVQNL